MTTYSWNPFYKALDLLINIYGKKEQRRIVKDSLKLEEESLNIHKNRLRGAKILLVEDNEINQEIACEILTQAGIQVDVAENGQVGAAMTTQKAYDGILMDIQMPVMDGYQSTIKIRENHNKKVSFFTKAYFHYFKGS